MQCASCDVEKLSCEFPKGRLTPSCSHRPNYCIKCIKEAASHRCPECHAPITEEKYKDLSFQLSLVTQEGLLTPPVRRPIARSPFTSYAPSVPIACTVATLEGDMGTFKVTTTTSVREFKELVARQFQIPSNVQRLMFGRQELKLYVDGGQAVMRDYNITDGSSLQVMRLLLSVTADTPYNAIKYTLGWTRAYGESRKFLDACCLAYSENSHHATVDFKNRYAVTGIQHSGSSIGTNRHNISVDLRSLGGSITHLFFVMSACHTDSLQSFRSPNVTLYDTARPGQPISSFDISRDGRAQAVIMCCMKRTEQGGWETFSLGTQTGGYCYNYYPIQATIRQLFAAGNV